VEEPSDLEWLKERALNVIGHELRTPTSTVRGLAEVLIANDDRDDRDELLAALVRNARRLELLLDDLLAAAGVTTALPVGPAEPVDLPEAIRGALNGTGPAVDISGAGVVFARPRSVGRIVSAVLDNARAYGDAPVTVAVRHDEDRVRAVVDSPGPELSPEDIRYALEPFWRGERAVTTRPGLGLGLAVASRLAAHEGGRLWVEGRSGGGLLTTLELPPA
jgi:two-component system phosphate regulon sensor histidine kinase PhoR